MTLADNVNTVVGNIRDKLNLMSADIVDASNVTIGTVAPTPATGIANLWLDTTGGSTRMKIVVGG